MKAHKPKDNGLGQCALCGRGIHGVSVTKGWSTFSDLVPYLRHDPIPRLRAIDDRSRTNCSSCNKPGPWYEFKPGDGRCKECAP